MTIKFYPDFESDSVEIWETERKHIDRRFFKLIIDNLKWLEENFTVKHKAAAFVSVNNVPVMEILYYTKPDVDEPSKIVSMLIVHRFRTDDYKSATFYKRGIAAE